MKPVQKSFLSNSFVKPVEEKNEYIVTDQLDKKTERDLNYFWLGFMIYTIAFLFFVTGYIGFNTCLATQIFGVLLFVSGAFNLVRASRNNYLKTIFFFYFGWSLTVVLRSYPFSYLDIKILLSDISFGAFPFLVPLIVLFPSRLIWYKKLFNLIFFFDILFLVFDALLIRKLLDPDRTSLISQGVVENLTQCLGISNGFLLLTSVYHSNKKRLFVIGVSVIILLLAIIRARRGLIFISACQILFSYCLYLYASQKRILTIFLSVFILFFAANSIKAIYEKKSGLFGFLIERGVEDTRTNVELCFFDDMKTKDWLIGRGIKGEYFCPDVDENNLTGYRRTIETGYLQIILNGGLVSLGLFLLIAFPAMIKGIFFSKNIFSKAAGIWILLSLINLYPGSLNFFSLYYLLVWVSIGICYSKSIRSIPDTKMKEYFQFNDNNSSDIVFDT